MEQLRWMLVELKNNIIICFKVQIALMCTICAKMLANNRRCMILNMKNRYTNTVAHVLLLNFDMPLEDPFYTPLYSSSAELVETISRLSHNRPWKSLAETGN